MNTNGKTTGKKINKASVVEKVKKIISCIVFFKKISELPTTDFK